MEITLNVDLLIENNLTLSEYTYLKALYEEKSSDEIAKLFKCIDRIEEDHLQAKGFIKIIEDGVILREKGKELFDSGSLFTKFLVMFPVKTPRGRYLSPLGADTIKADKLEKKWDKLFKNKPHLERQALDVLEAELKWRRDTNQLEFIHNAETWLNQGDYENYKYLLDDYQEDTQSYNDFM